MSRCFPFPPPGYEKKTRTDDVDLLRKEKKREKKHKKDKDKEKKEKREKREKEGREKKPKDKDKKEKNREKKKDKDKDKVKDRDRDKSKTCTADGKGLAGQAEGLNAGKLQKEIKPDKKDVFVDNKIIKQYTGNNGEMAKEINHLAKENKDSKFLLEFERRIKDDDNGATGNQLVQKFTNADHRKDEGTVRFLARNSGIFSDDSEKLEDKVLDAKKIEGKGINAEVRPFGNATAQNHTGNFHLKADGGFDAKKIERKGINAEVRPFGNATVQNHAGNFRPKADGIPKLLGKYIDRNWEATVGGKEKVDEKKDRTVGGKEKIYEKKEEGKEKVMEKKEEGKDKVKEKKEEGKEKDKKKKDDKRGEKRKNKEEKKGHGKDKDRDKKKEKTKEYSLVKTTEQNKLKESNNVGPIHTNSFTQISKNSHENSVVENSKKRKEIESNGVPRANENWPSKLPRSSSSHPFTENGRILEPCKISIPNASDRPEVAVSSSKMDNKECKINGFIEAQPHAVPSNKTHTTTMPALPVIEASTKPPHPDTKYLNHIYSVPKVEWSVLDDQEWLFDSSISQERKPMVKSSDDGETPQVWAEAVHLKPADVFALPYVIPY
ncbi:unnamed protein product [Lathyrus oleraceus]|uniref:Myb-like protein X n=1 Tax=Pisum sativum TaxID=3888 RepID=A0A9D4ZVB8_PEA|nr:uncharacterized protein LOC127100571 [Pisum sativum]XP_050893755.1 uncharacterized protein LOC127100571 [Pisum sativum]XP_050893756.1 uncharacterized protein LOC127100571 [Pisum sativum]KAI5385089.1 hypothetical protein KIW84_071909 [Pisum sativum]